MNKLSDEQLVARYLHKNNELALEELVKRYLPLIYGFVKKYTGNQDNASDITQEVFVKVWKNLRSFDQAKSFRTWIFTIAKRTAIDELRKNNALPFSFLAQENEDFAESISDNTPSILNQLLFKETSRELSFAMSQLPANYSSIIKLHLEGQMHFKEIAESLKKPLNTVKSQYRRGLVILNRILSK